MIRYFLLLGILLVAFSCQKNDAAPKEYEVVAQGVGGDCRLPLIDFVDKQQNKEVGRMFGSSLSAYSESGRYYALNLPTTIPQGTKVYITIRQLKPDEERACTTMGPAYNTVFTFTYRVE
ncbi:hypothetical protein H8B15_11335 [Hymenobacter sp. BT507]|uniref:Lipoprotein n=1 Tax=Hymenobacter citatus TaxID=2763506 RepID=A0ABR7MKB2_9BACT|nr:hypothetical protein [Hymenobacter citatus]MBC6611522.1 hypothetical protein [Hymenobacter citatus]